MLLCCTGTDLENLKSSTRKSPVPHVEEQGFYSPPVRRGRCMNADGKGFEPLRRGYRLLVFKTSSFGRSDNHPCAPETGILSQRRAAGHYEIIS